LVIATTGGEPNARGAGVVGPFAIVAGVAESVAIIAPAELIKEDVLSNRVGNRLLPVKRLRNERFGRSKVGELHWRN